MRQYKTNRSLLETISISFGTFILIGLASICVIALISIQFK